MSMHVQMSLVSSPANCNLAVDDDLHQSCCVAPYMVYTSKEENSDVPV